MIRTQVYIPDDLHRDLTLLAQTSKKNISELIREGAREVIKKQAKKRGAKDPWKDFIGGIKGVKTNSIRDVQEYYEKFAI